MDYSTFSPRRDNPQLDPNEQNVVNDSAGPMLQVKPEQSVYSAILYLPAISRLKDGNSWNRHAKLALFLCLLNAMLQMGVVRVIEVYDYQNRLANSRMLLPSDEVIETGDNAVEKYDKEWSDSARKSADEVHRRFLPPRETADLDAVQNIEPLCKRIGDGNGTFTCMPHSVKFAFEWKDLDVDGDGVWTIDEAKCDYRDLKKKRKVAPETIFNNMINGLRMQAAYMRHSGSNHTLFLPKVLQEEKGIPKAYFHFWQGDAMMCGLFDADSCEAAAKSGVFTAALVPGRMSAQFKGIYDLDSAIKYCYRMLQDGGGCEALLPVDFKRNREQRWERCGARSFSEGGKYTNPYDDTQNVHILEANYGSVAAYERATSRLYLFFLSLVIVLWFLALVSELRELVKQTEFLIVFPGIQAGQSGGTSMTAASPGSAASLASDELVYTITGITMRHRIVMIVIFLVRISVFSVLSKFGTRFLIGETDYFDLVLNSLALTFILTIDGMLFALVEKASQDIVLNSKPIEFETSMPSGDTWTGYLLKKECWGLIAIPLLAVGCVLYDNYRIKLPMLTVLRCACTQEGEKCLDSIQYQAGWWSEYWGKVLPAAIHHIEAMRLNATSN